MAHMDTIPGEFAANIIRYIPTANWAAVMNAKKPVTIMFPIVMAYIL